MAAEKRILKEIHDLRQESPKSTGISLLPGNDDLYSWDAVILGPYNSEWEGGRFKLSVQFMPDHPFKPPHVKFTSRKVFHPNVYTDGEICMDILKDGWGPALTLLRLLVSIQSLLCDANPNAPANPEAASLYVENRREYYKRVEKIVEESLFEC